MVLKLWQHNLNVQLVYLVICTHVNEKNWQILFRLVLLCYSSEDGDCDDEDDDDGIFGLEPNDSDGKYVCRFLFI